MQALSIAAVAVCLGLSAVAWAHRTVEVRPGENVTLSCANISKDETQVDWFRVENGTKASCISSMLGDDPPSYCTGFQNGRFRMGSNKTDVFLNIDEVDFLDTGLYICGFFIKSNIVLGETIYLRVTGDADSPDHLQNISPKAEYKLDEFLLLIIVGSLGAVLAIVVIALAANNCKLKKAIKELRDEANATPSEDVNYAALNVKATNRPGSPRRPVEPHVIYSCPK